MWAEICRRIEFGLSLEPIVSKKLPEKGTGPGANVRPFKFVTRNVVNAERCLATITSDHEQAIRITHLAGAEYGRLFSRAGTSSI